MGRQSILSVVAVAMLSATTSASNIYQYFEEDTNSVLATIEFSSLPATQNEVLDFSLTPAGQIWFGYGPTDVFDLDFSLDQMADVGDGELRGNRPLATQSSPPPSPQTRHFMRESGQPRSRSL